MTDTPIRLSPGDAAPDFALSDSTGARVSLSDLLASGRSLILYVYPAAMRRMTIAATTTRPKPRFR